MQAGAAFIALPGVVAYVVPYLIGARTPHSGLWRWTGLVLIVAGTVGLLRCVRDFLVTGRGTLAPWSPPQHLITAGLYSRSRNPMYVAVLVILVGWSVWFQSPVHLAYALAVATAFYLRIRFYEEPRLEAAFGREWHDYKVRVGRWL